jgi:hypothetical protein
LRAANKEERIAGIRREVVQLLIRFYRPFKEESQKLEGEKYPTLPIAQLAFHRLKSHCNRPLIFEGEEEEELCFTLMRERAIELLGTKVKISVTHSIGLFFYPPYRKLQRLPEAARNTVCI